MSSRRQFLALGSGLVLGLWKSAPRLLADNRERLSEGSDTKKLITPEAQKAIDRGLEYLVQHQHDDGGFGDRQQYYGNIAITSLAGLALMAAGHQPGRGRHGKAVKSALQYVLDHEDRSQPGFLYIPNTQAHGPMYSHGFATLFLAEAHGMVQDKALGKQLRDTLVRAVRLIESTQNSQGGWRYDPRPKDADISVTICQIMALRSARNAGIFVRKSTVDACIKYVKQCQILRGGENDGGFQYSTAGGPVAFARTAAGVAALYSAGVYEGKEVERGLKYLLRNKNNAQNPHFRFAMRRDLPDIHYYYGHYYAAQVMWTAGGKYWSEWYPFIRDELLERAGSSGKDGAWEDQIDSHYATAMACIILQIPNNYLPIMQK